MKTAQSLQITNQNNVNAQTIAAHCAATSFAITQAWAFKNGDALLSVRGIDDQPRVTVRIGSSVTTLDASSIKQALQRLGA